MGFVRLYSLYGVVTLDTFTMDMVIRGAMGSDVGGGDTCKLFVDL